MHNILYNRLYYGQFLCIIPLIFILKKCEGISGIISIVTLALISSYLTYNAIVLFRVLPNKIPYLKTFYAGSILVVSNSLLDIIVTITCSPDLAREGNLIVLMLFKTHTPLWSIYLLMLFFELAFIALSISLWGCFLKNYDDMLARIPYKNLMNTLKWLSGSGAIPGKNWFFNPKIDTYFAISTLSTTFVVIQISRVYVTLEWLEFIPTSSYLRLTAIITIVSSGFIGLICFTHYKLKKISNK